MTQARSTRFLIVGAAGSHGATGNYAARQLRGRGEGRHGPIAGETGEIGAVTDVVETIG